jgi:hypothetical protein
MPNYGVKREEDSKRSYQEKVSINLKKLEHKTSNPFYLLVLLHKWIMNKEIVAHLICLIYLACKRVAIKSNKKNHLQLKDVFFLIWKLLIHWKKMIFGVRKN